MLLAACALVELCYVFIASAGRFTRWPTYAWRVDQLAEAFRAGQLHLLIEPSPALLAAKNPLDPVNANLWYWDATLYKGHFYFYWGPVPALLLAAAKTVLRIGTPLGDEVAVFALASLQLVAGTVLLERLARRLFGGIPIVLVALAVIVLGLANPTPFILARQEVYEAAIVGGHAFLVTGVALAFEAMACADVPRRSLAFAVGASSAWALALGCRISIAPALPFLALTTALAMTWQRSARWKHLVKSLVATGTPLALGVGGLLVYNKARFEHWFEFGTRYQMTWLDFKVSTDFVALNAYSYALRPLQTSCKFPFTVSTMGVSPELVFPKGFTFPPHYYVYEQTAGALVTTPWMWFFIPALVLLGALLWRVVRRKGPLDAASITTLGALLVLLIASTFTLLVPLVANTTTMRYLGDAAPAFTLFASFGAFATYAALRRAAIARALVVLARALVVLVLAGAALTSAALGLALGIEGYYKHFKHHNPALLDKLEKRYSVCTTPKP